MKFLVDAHLPPSLCTVLSDAGHETLHTSELPAIEAALEGNSLVELDHREVRVVG